MVEETPKYLEGEVRKRDLSPSYLLPCSFSLFCIKKCSCYSCQKMDKKGEEKVTRFVPFTFLASWKSFFSTYDLFFNPSSVFILLRNLLHIPVAFKFSAHSVFFLIKFSGSSFEYYLCSDSTCYWNYAICKQVGAIFPKGIFLGFLLLLLVDGFT